MRIKLTDDQVDAVLLWEMKRHRKVLKSIVDSLKRRKNLERFEREDLKRSMQVLQAIEVVIDYYSMYEYDC